MALRAFHRQGRLPLARIVQQRYRKPAMSFKLSTKGRYGLRAMIDLAQAYGEGPVLVRSVADRQEVSSKYLHALLGTLKSAGLVRSVRGSGGGYALARHPSEVRLTEIVEALEGPLSVVDCVADEALCRRSASCAVRDVWLTVSEAVTDVLSSLTLEELVERQRAKEAGSA